MGSSKLSEKPDEMLGGNLAMNEHPIQGRVVQVILYPLLCYGNWDKIQVDGPIGSSTDCFFYLPVPMPHTLSCSVQLCRAIE